MGISGQRAGRSKEYISAVSKGSTFSALQCLHLAAFPFKLERRSPAVPLVAFYCRGLIPPSGSGSRQLRPEGAAAAALALHSFCHHHHHHHRHHYYHKPFHFTAMSIRAERGFSRICGNICDLGWQDCQVSGDITSQPSRNSFHWLIWLFQLVNHSPAVMTHSR